MWVLSGFIEGANVKQSEVECKVDKILSEIAYISSFSYNLAMSKEKCTDQIKQLKELISVLEKYVSAYDYAEDDFPL